MRAVVAREPGGPEVLDLTDVPTPTPPPGWVLIAVKALGLNRAEVITRAGHSPGVEFPRILGIECVGTIEAVGEGVAEDIGLGGRAAAMVGGMGRQFDGSYAEYACVPATQVMPLGTNLPWESLGAIPETFVTAYASLHDALGVDSGTTVLVRGGSSSVGMAATTVAKDAGASVIATTRNPDKVAALHENGADTVLVDDGRIAGDVGELTGGGADRTLELVGTATLEDSLAATAPGGVACMTGILSGWELRRFRPMEAIPPAVRLTAYTSGRVTRENTGSRLAEIVARVEDGRYRLRVDRVFRLDEIPEAHRYIEGNNARGKVVALIGG